MTKTNDNNKNEMPQGNKLGAIPETKQDTEEQTMTQMTLTQFTMTRAPSGQRQTLVLKVEINNPKKPTEQEPNPITQHLKQFISTVITKHQEPIFPNMDDKPHNLPLFALKHNDYLHNTTR